MRNTLNYMLRLRLKTKDRLRAETLAKMFDVPRSEVYRKAMLLGMQQLEREAMTQSGKNIEGAFGVGTPNAPSLVL